MSPIEPLQMVLEVSYTYKCYVDRIICQNYMAFFYDSARFFILKKSN